MTIYNPVNAKTALTGFCVGKILLGFFFTSEPFFVILSQK